MFESEDLAGHGKISILFSPKYHLTVTEKLQNEPVIAIQLNELFSKGTVIFDHQIS